MADINLPPGLAEAIQLYFQQGGTVPPPVVAPRTTADVIAEAEGAANNLAQDALGVAVRLLAEAVRRLYQDANGVTGA